jgi:hypothetical protein
VKKLSNYWPKSVAHLKEPYDDGVSDHVIIAEISKASRNGYKGQRLISTALVPLDKLKVVLNTPGGIGWEVKSWGPLPCVDAGEIYNTQFWIEGKKGSDERFQTIINAWSYHNQEVVLPDNVMLMAYGLVPRQLNDGIVCWDDPHAPTYDVLHVKSRVDHSAKGTEPLAQITIRRDYLEDYCSLKGCAAVAVYYEERFSADDKTFERVLNGKKGVELQLPGRLLGMAVLEDEYHKNAPQMSRVWGCRKILVPAKRPITDADDPVLVWPGDKKPMTLLRSAEDWVYGCVSDEVLCDYEAHTEFSIYPESGSISYNGWWSVGRCHRVGRNHIQVELKGLYEGSPPHVISHWHRFAVSKKVAESDRKTHGDNNIALRAKAIAYAYLQLTETLEKFSDDLEAGFTQGDIGSLVTKDVEYVGWWSVPVLKQLSAVAKQTAAPEQFLARAVSLFKLLENLKQAPLRNLVLSLGVPKKKIKDFGSLKLLACLCRLAEISRERGFYLPEDAKAVAKQWNPNANVAPLNSVFALNVLRICQAHTPSAEQDKKIATACAVFGIDVTSTHGGWGYAIDKLYDTLSRDLSELSKLLRSVLR